MLDIRPEQFLTRHKTKEENDSLVVQKLGNSDEKLLRTNKKELVIKIQNPRSFRPPAGNIVGSLYHKQ